MAPSTIKRYNYGWLHWVAFCRAGNIPTRLAPDPAAAAQLLGCYIAYGHKIKGLRASTLRGRVAAVLHYHRVHNFACPSLAQPFLAALLRGAERASGPAHKRQPLFLHTILSSRPPAGSDQRLLLLWYGVLLSFHLLLRTSELWAGWNGQAHPLYCLRATSVTFFDAGGAPLPYAQAAAAASATVALRGAKNDQGRHGATALLPAAAPPQAGCPVAALAAICGPRPPHLLHWPLMTLFPADGPPRVLPAAEASAFIQAAARAAGFEPADYKPYSPRIGAATTLAASGVDARTITTAGRWRSDAFLAYVRANAADYHRITSSLLQSAAAPVLPVGPPPAGGRRL